MINLNQLRAFYEAAKCHNISVAAKNLFVSQPAVTAQVKLFEDSCGLKLFKKKGRNLHLTDDGKTLYRYARKIFKYEKEIEDAVEQMKELKRGTLRLGAARTYARYFMPFLLTDFRDAYPNIKIVLDEGSSAEMIQSLFKLKNELVIVAKALENRDISFLAKAAVSVELQAGKLGAVPINGQDIFLDVSIAYLKKQLLSISAGAFLKSLEKLGTRKIRFQGMGDRMQKMIAHQG